MPAILPTCPSQLGTLPCLLSVTVDAPASDRVTLTHGGEAFPRSLLFAYDEQQELRALFAISGRRSQSANLHVEARYECNVKIVGENTRYVSPLSPLSKQIDHLAREGVYIVVHQKG